MKYHLKSLSETEFHIYGSNVLLPSFRMIFQFPSLVYKSGLLSKFSTIWYGCAKFHILMGKQNLKFEEFISTHTALKQPCFFLGLTQLAFTAPLQSGKKETLALKCFFNKASTDPMHTSDHIASSNPNHCTVLLTRSNTIYFLKNHQRFIQVMPL